MNASESAAVQDKMLSDTYAVKVEIYSVVVGAHLKALTCHVHNDW
jgi:hypothetical protein